MLSNEQQNIINSIMNDLKQNASIFGYAGTGKTTMTKALIEELKSKHLSVIALAPTGCAVKNLQKKLPMQVCQTIHKSLIPILNEKTGEFHFTSQGYEYDVIIIDEISMVEGSLLTEVLKRAKNSLIITLGDHAQLPPTNVKTNKNLEKILNIRGFKSYHLTKVFRQDDGNSILDLATQFRLQKNVILENYLDKSEIIHTKDLYSAISNMSIDEYQFLSPTNSIRNKVNEIKRRNNTDLILDERLMLTTNLNDAEDWTMYNGDIFENCTYINSELKTQFDKEIKHDNFSYENYTVSFPSNSYELAYCITVHKAQGNEFDNVCLILPQYWQHIDFISQELLYTAVTRAKQKITIIILGE